MNVEARALGKGSGGRREPGEKGRHASSGKTPRRLSRIRWAHPTRASAQTLGSRRQRPLRPAIPTLRAAVAPRAARGRPGPQVASVPRLPLGFRGLPHPEAELGTQRMGVDPSQAPTRDPPRRAPRSPVLESPSNPLTRLQKKASHRLPA